jgi:hypothetical protein
VTVQCETAPQGIAEPVETDQPVRQDIEYIDLGKLHEKNGLQIGGRNVIKGAKVLYEYAVVRDDLPDFFVAV